jgi:C-terminal processing protease CtpA/Prc
MKLNPVGLLTLISTSILSWAGEVSPARLLENLGSEKFKEREAAQGELIKWVEKNGVREIYQTYVNSDDPEVRARCHRILRDQSDKDYLNDGQGYMGVQMREEMSLIEGDERPRACVRIALVVPDGPADIAGLKAGDLIVSMDQEKWYEPNVMELLIKKIADYKPLRKVNLIIQRTGEINLLEIPVVLGKRPVPDLRMMRHEAMQELDQQARQKHFEEWLKKQQLEKK